MYGFICPVCGEPLKRENGVERCRDGHSFDVAKEGYVNLLTGSRSGSLTGDSADMARCRRAFLSKGYFDALAEEVCRIAGKYGFADGNFLDICCGEGHYSSYVKNKLPDADVLGFDLSREMVKRASKQNRRVGYAVANMTSVPVEDNSVDVAFQLFAPFYSSEFTRILSDNGVLISVVAGERHLIELKELLYDKPYLNEVREPSDGSMKLLTSYDLNSSVTIATSEDIKALFGMTPYCRHTSRDAAIRLFERTSLDVTLSFHIFIYGKRETANEL